MVLFVISVGKIDDVVLCAIAFCVRLCCQEDHGRLAIVHIQKRPESLVRQGSK